MGCHAQLAFLGAGIFHEGMFMRECPVGRFVQVEILGGYFFMAKCPRSGVSLSKCKIKCLYI